MKTPEQPTEFGWEAIFKKDDAQIRKYMAMLPQYIDIPGEDSIILERIEGEEKISSFEYAGWQTDFSEDEDLLADEWDAGRGTGILKKVAARSRHLLLIQNALISEEDGADAMRAIGIFAIITGRLISAINACDESPAFALAHCKRTHEHVNELESMFRKMRSAQPNISRLLDREISALSEISEMISEWIFEIRK
jgi:hypothetical protein